MRSAAVWTNPQCGQVHVAFGMSYRDLRAMAELLGIPYPQLPPRLESRQGEKGAEAGRGRDPGQRLSSTPCLPRNPFFPFWLELVFLGLWASGFYSHWKLLSTSSIERSPIRCNNTRGARSAGPPWIRQLRIAPLSLRQLNQESGSVRCGPGSSFAKG